MLQVFPVFVLGLEESRQDLIWEAAFETQKHKLKKTVIIKIYKKNQKYENHSNF